MTKSRTLNQKVCKQCHSLFESNNTRKVYCSPRCSRKAQSSKQISKRKSKVLFKTCPYCHKTFSTHIKLKLYCSKECLTQLNRDKYISRDRDLSSFKLFERDNFTCIYCGKSSINDGVKLVMDHIYPRNMGGKNDIINMVTSCVECNAQKKDSLLQQDIILDLWKRNQSLMNKLDVVEQYDSLLSHLNHYYKESKGES